jgi:Uma2 family endonuclease
MGEAGVFSENDRVELIEGEILKKSPIGSRHAASVNRLNMLFNNLLGARAIVSVQNPVVLNDFSEPEPDLAILKRRDDFYAEALPSATDVLLVIEIADTSVAYDHEIKLPAYARSGIPEVWLVDLPAETVGVHAEPVNGVYRAVRSYRRGDLITPLHFPDLSIDVASILG